MRKYNIVWQSRNSNDKTQIKYLKILITLFLNLTSVMSMLHITITLRRELHQRCVCDYVRFHADPPENCHLTVKKLPKT